MSIPLPFPNINDTASNDVQTWSSSKILDYLKPALETEGNKAVEKTGAEVTFTDIDPDTCTVTKADIEIELSSDSFSSLTFEHTGENIFTRDNEQTPAYINNVGSIQTGAAANGWALSDYIEVKAGETYYFQPNSQSGSSAKHGYFNSSKTFVSAINSGAGSFTVPSGIKYMRFSYRTNSTDIQLRTSDSHTIALGSTYYGGTFDVLDGTGKAYDGDEVLQDITFTPITFNLFEGTNVFSCAPAGTVDIEITCTDTIGNILKKEGIL